MSIATYLAQTQRARALRALGVVALGLRVATRTTGGAHEILFELLMLAIITAAVVALRFRRVVPRPAERVETAIDTAIAAVASTILAVLGSWIACVVVLLACGLESPRIPFPVANLNQRIIRLFSLGVSALLLPVAGMAVSGRLTGVGLEIFLVTVPLAFAELPDIFRDSAASKRNRVLALAGITVATALIAWGQPLSLPLDRSLLAAAPGVLFVIVGWLTLLDPLPDRRMERTETLTRTASVVTILVLLLVM